MAENPSCQPTNSIKRLKGNGVPDYVNMLPPRCLGAVSQEHCRRNTFYHGQGDPPVAQPKTSNHTM